MSPKQDIMSSSASVIQFQNVYCTRNSICQCLRFVQVFLIFFSVTKTITCYTITHVKGDVGRFQKQTKSPPLNRTFLEPSRKLRISYSCSITASMSSLSTSVIHLCPHHHYHSHHCKSRVQTSDQEQSDGFRT